MHWGSWGIDTDMHCPLVHHPSGEKGRISQFHSHQRRHDAIAGLLFDSYEAHWQRRGWIFVVVAAVEAAAHAVDRWNNRGPGNAMRHMLQFQEEEANKRTAKPIAKSATELHTPRYNQGHPDHNTDTAVDIDVVDDAAAAAAADVDNNCS